MNVDSFEFAEEAYEGELEIILSHVINCHSAMVNGSYSVINSENKLRNILIKDFLTNAAIKKELGITGYKFRPEVAVIDDNYDEIGYTDIEVSLLSHFENDDAIFILECKRIDGGTDLNNKYVRKGIKRFIDEQYPCYFALNAMIGFCVEKIDVNANISSINQQVKKWCSSNTMNYITSVTSSVLPHTYTSKHSSSKSASTSFVLYHAMLDMSSIIVSS